MVAAQEPRPKPYVGPQPFTRRDRQYFFGRDIEAFELQSLMEAERIVLLCSPSGAGKTSLVQATVVPAFENDFLVLPIIRVNRVPADIVETITDAAPAGPAPNRYLASTIFSLQHPTETAAGAAQSGGEQRLSPALATQPLSDYLDARRPQDDDRPELLIFDQFEEILTLDPTDGPDKQQFFEMLGEALVNRQRWALFAMREDYIAGLEPYTYLLPTGMSTTFRLDLLGTDAALAAIREPASRFGVEFNQDAAEQLIADLSRMKVQTIDGQTVEKIGPYVEPVQLQVVCDRLWTRDRTDPTRVTLADVQGSGDLGHMGEADVALAEYYADSVKRCADTLRIPEREIRRFFEFDLITEQGIRGQVLLGSAQATRLPPQAYQTLVGDHVMRAEPRGGRIWYELAHDRLIDPVRANNQTWFKDNLRPFQLQAPIWLRQGRLDSLLLRGQQWAEDATWIEEHDRELTAEEKEFVAACTDEAEREREEAERAQREHEAAVRAAVEDAEHAREEAERETLRGHNRRLRRAIVAAAVFAVLAVVLAGIASWQYLAQLDHARLALARQLGAEALAHLDQRDLALLLSLESVRVNNDRMASDGLNGSFAMLGGELLPGSFRRDLGRLLGLGGSNADTDTQASLFSSLTYSSGGFVPARFLRDHTATVTSVAYSPKGQYLAASGADHRIIIWDGTTGAKLKELPGATETLAFSPDGTLLVSGTPTGEIVFWQVANWTPLGDPIPADQGHFQMTRLAFSPDGTRLASASRDGTVAIWDPANRQRVSVLRNDHGKPTDDRGYTGEIWALAFSPNDSETLVTGSRDDWVRIWNLRDLSQHSIDLHQYTGWVRSVVFAPDGKLLAIGGGGDEVHLVDLSVPKDPRPPTSILLGHTSSVLGLAFTPDGKRLASGSVDHTIIIWDPVSRQRVGDPLAAQADWVWSVAFSPDGKRLAAGSVDHTVVVWSLPELARPLTGHSRYVTSVAFSPDGTRLASASDDKTILVRQAPFDQVAMTLGGPLGHREGIRGIAFSPDSRKLVSVGLDNQSLLWNVETGKVDGPPLIDGDSDVNAVAFNPNGQEVATVGCLRTGCPSSAVRLWDLADRSAPRLRLPGPTTGIWSVAYNGDGTLLAAGVGDGEIQLWDLPAGTPHGEPLQGHTGQVVSLAFSPDGRTLASGSLDTTARLWDLSGDTSAPLTLIGHRGSVRGLAFSPDGKILATGSGDREIRFWTADGGRQLGLPLRGHTDAIWSLAFSPDGHLLASGGYDNLVILWDMDHDSWRTTACRVAGRDLNEQEWRQYFGDEPRRTTCPERGLAAGGAP